MNIYLDYNQWIYIPHFKNQPTLVQIRVDRPMIEHSNIEGKPYPKWGLCCFQCPNITWIPPLGAFDTLTIVKKWLEMKKLWPCKVHGKNSQIETTKHYNGRFWNIQFFFIMLVCCYYSSKMICKTSGDAPVTL